LLAKPTSRNVNLDSDRFAMFNKERDIPHDNHEMMQRLSTRNYLERKRTPGPFGARNS